jgi:hypothetical protein
VIDWGKHVLSPCIGVFGEPAIFIPAAGTPFPINGVFDNAYSVVTMSDYGTPVSTLHPAIGVNLSDFPAAPLQGDQIIIARTGKTYVVREPRPDSHGWAFLILNYVSG